MPRIQRLELPPEDKAARSCVIRHGMREAGAPKVRRKSWAKRLASVKSVWDPTNLFRQNKNIPPGRS